MGKERGLLFVLVAWKLRKISKKDLADLRAAPEDALEHEAAARAELSESHADDLRELAGSLLDTCSGDLQRAAELIGAMEPLDILRGGSGGAIGGGTGDATANMMRRTKPICLKSSRRRLAATGPFRAMARAGWAMSISSTTTTWTGRSR